MEKYFKVCVLLSIIMLPLCSYAQKRWLPGGSQYFSASVQKQIQKSDIMWDTLNTRIYEYAHGDHAKDLVIRAYLYQYCGKQAQHLLDTQGIQTKKTTAYNKYISLQTALYQSLQPTVVKARLVLQSPALSFQNVVDQLQSEDDRILYFYSTLPQRYNDLPMIEVLPILQKALQSYKNANNNYPANLDDLVTYGFLPSVYKSTISQIAYIAHNRPFINAVKVSYVKRFVPILSWYVLAGPVLYSPNANIQTHDEDSMKALQRTSQYSDRQNNIKKHAILESDGMLWQVVIGKL